VLVFIIPAGYPNKYNKNSCSFIHEQVKRIQKNGHDVVVLDASSYRINKWFDKNCFKIEKRNFDGVNVISLHYWGLKSTGLPRLNMFLYNFQLERLYKKAISIYGKPDLLHAHFSFIAGFGAYKLSKKINVPYMVTEHYSLYLQETLNKYILKILNITVNEASRYICVSETLKKAIERWTKTNRKISVIPNLIDDRFSYYPILENDKFVFFAAGNIYKSKRFDLLVEAFCVAFNPDEKVVLNIAGAGTEYENIKDLIAKKERMHQINLLGSIGRDQILEQLKICHCFALPSIYETFGIVYREAMAVGRPVISAKNGGIEENWEDAFGILTEIDDIEGFSKAMIDVCKNYENYDKEYISKSCIEKYSSNIIIKKIEYEMLYSINENKK